MAIKQEKYMNKRKYSDQTKGLEGGGKEKRKVEIKEGREGDRERERWTLCGKDMAGMVKKRRWGRKGERRNGEKLLKFLVGQTAGK